MGALTLGGSESESLTRSREVTRVLQKIPGSIAAKSAQSIPRAYCRKEGPVRPCCLVRRATLYSLSAAWQRSRDCHRGGSVLAIVTAQPPCARLRIGLLMTPGATALLLSLASSQEDPRA